MERKEVIKRFSLTTTQSKKIDKYVFELLDFNKHKIGYRTTLKRYRILTLICEIKIEDHPVIFGLAWLAF